MICGEGDPESRIRTSVHSGQGLPENTLLSNTNRKMQRGQVQVAQRSPKAKIIPPLC